MAAGCSLRPIPAAAIDQKKLCEELATLGIDLDPWGQAVVSAKSPTADGDFKPGVAARLTQLQCFAVRALDLPVFGVGAGKAIAAIPGLQRIELMRTHATEEAVAALGECATLETLNLNNGLHEYPIVTDAGLAGLGKLKSLEILQCQQGKITSAGVSALGGLTKLKQVNFNNCPIDDLAAPTLAKLNSLVCLDVAYTKMTGKGLRLVASGLPKLANLDSDGTGVTDADMPAFAALPQLTLLSIADTAVTDAGMKELAKSKSLGAVVLSGTKVTDAGVVSLTRLPKLVSLTLRRLPLTDACLTELVKVPNLLELRLGANDFTAEGLAKFAAARPKVEVYK